MIMDTTSTADNTTVVAGPSSAVNHKEHIYERSESTKQEKDIPYSTGLASEKPIPNDFVRAADYSMEDRQFFVIIGHDGLIGALQKLDAQLQQVRLYLIHSAIIY